MFRVSGLGFRRVHVLNSWVRGFLVPVPVVQVLGGVDDYQVLGPSEASWAILEACRDYS